MSTEEKFTERQAKAWTEAVADIQSRGVDVGDNIYGGYWTADWDEETRPGRGHRVNAIWNDGEHFVQVLMDVYGSPSVSIAALDWLHSSSDEECECDRCYQDRRDMEQAVMDHVETGADL